MNYQLAQLNIARFRVQQNDPVNKGFVDNLDRINAIAESQPGFLWRLKGDGNNALDVAAFEDPNVIVNLSVWTNTESLFNFVYKNSEHTGIMRNRKQWFDRLEFFMVLWWVEEGRRPGVEEAKMRLDLLQRIGPTYSAFTFKKPFAAPSGE
ncbi:DUF3291 domain-containing protein [Granulosicoccus antarcticus]|uniref:DUF3291 domain-containing protein n=1 Tax=Granulosicoccus antarcticus IMCC3135 TaxID=1192854 RepID=A0A2Z2P0W6_9GAMM|nr:DUF3291 domain-containing protein [Granulosicoccus antarcticus]ASJ75798.1 hypothetical protein IMCC3135_28730 [Granulosicoccus antarcticus IMCC3135]